MNVPSTTVRPSPASYPQQPPSVTPEWRDLLSSVAQQTGTGVELRRELRPQERDALRARSRDLLPWMKGGTANEIKKLLARCFQGFNYAPTPAEAQAIAVQYITVLKDQPLWAIERACMRFASGTVRPEEVGAKKLDLAVKPTTAQLRMIVEDTVEEIARELRIIQGALKAEAPRKPPTKEEIAKTNADIERWRAEKGVKPPELVVSAEQKRDTAQRLDKAHRDRVLKEYETAGLPPPEEKPNKALVSLALLLHMGWRIEELPHGVKVLTQPPPPPPPKYSHADEGR